MARRAGILLYIFVLLMAVEILLEFRAHLHGWSSLLFGQGRASAVARRIDSQGGYGPTKNFPFRSLVLNHPTKQLVFWVASSSMGVHEQLAAQFIFPNVFHAMLERKKDGVAVINASRVASGIIQNTNTLGILGPIWRPRYAILYNMSNDINRMSKAMYGPTRENEQQGTSLKWALPFLENTTMYTLTKKVLSSNLAQRRILWDGLGDEGKKEFEHLITGFVQQSRQLGVEPVLCTFATSHKMESFDQWPLAVKSFLFSYNIYLSPKGWATTIDGFNDIIREVAQREKVGLIDAYKELAGNKEYFVDFVHFSPFGHEKLGRIFADYFENILASHQRN